MTILSIKDLSIHFDSSEGLVKAVKNISFDIPKGKTIGLVGESGSGKSVTSLSIMGLIPKPPGIIPNGELIFDSKDSGPVDLLKLSESELRKIRGKRISMIFQEPMTSLNPVFTVGHQVDEVLMLHEDMSRSEAKERTIELFDQVGIPDPAQRYKSYPHEMSGGQKQRVMIAMAIACSPELLIADEPTTALDVTIQKQVLELIADLQSKYGMSVLFITHDLGVIADIADEVIVMYKGDLVEKNTAQSLFKNPQHPYTKGLLECRPALSTVTSRLPTVSDFMNEDGSVKSPDTAPKEEQVEKSFADSTPLLQIKDLTKTFVLKKSLFGKPLSTLTAVNKVTLDVCPGQTLGLVGESGCGKTTLGRLALRLLEADNGEVLYKGENILKFDRKKMLAMRKKMQIIFQDPYASLNPRMSIAQTLMEPMRIHGIAETRKIAREKSEHLLETVGLKAMHMARYPHEFSGGQRQRICIARALAVEPDFIICDESVSALDVSVQAQVLNLLLDLQDKLSLTYIFISHDLSVVKFISDHVVVMNQGEIVEMSTAEEIYRNPQQDYTKRLLSAIPKGL